MLIWYLKRLSLYENLDDSATLLDDRIELGFGIDFAGAVKERQGRADRQLCNTWGRICPLRIRSFRGLVPRVTDIVTKGWGERLSEG